MSVNLLEIRACFSAAWEAGQRPRIEDYLNRVAAAERPALFRELLAIELDLRRQRGENIGRQDYGQRFPEFTDLIKQFLEETSTLPPAPAAEIDSSPDPFKTGPNMEDNAPVAAVPPEAFKTGAVAERREDGAQPARVGRYVIASRLGSGGFGTVYKGFDEQLRREVAIKVPHRQRIARPEDAEAYLAEAQILAGLDHPHIVPVFDVGRTEDGSCFVVSKFIQGSDLAVKIRTGRFPSLEAAQLLAQIAEALHHAHVSGLVHRDVKPGNVLLDKCGTAYVADFGLALREEDFGKGAGLCGTPAYMSPEQARGEGHRVDGRSDIFSLGVVMYELLTGRRPFRGEQIEALLHQIVTDEPRPPRQIDDQIPRELERICLKALAKKASERYTTAKDLAEDLRCFLSNPAARLPTMPNLPDTVTGTGLSLSGQSTTIPVKIVPKGLRSFDAKDAGFFLELVPGPRARGDLPESIRFWKTRIEETDADQTFRVGLICGPSGCGKSSLIKAGLLPQLADHVEVIYVESSAGETETRLLKGLSKTARGLDVNEADRPSRPGGSRLVEALSAVRRGQGIAAGRKLLIVLDQFEQWLHARRGEEHPELVEALRQCDGGRLQGLILVRDDFWMATIRFMRALEVPLIDGHNSAAVDLFDRRHARKVLAAFGRAFGALPDSTLDRAQTAFLEQAAAALAQDGKIICVQLALFTEMIKDKPWVPATLPEVGGIAGAGVAFLEETFSAAGAPPKHRLHQQAARAILKALLPEAGIDIKGHMRAHAELLAASGYADHPGDFDDCMRILDGGLRLITPADPEGEVNSSLAAGLPNTAARYYQLTHDYLVPALREWLTRKQKETRRGRAEILLGQRAAAWKERPEDRQLPSLSQWLRICWLTRKSTWTGPQRKMMRRATRYHALRLAIAAAVIAVSGWASYQGHGRLQAHALRDELLTARTSEVAGIVKQMAPYRSWLDPLLREAYQAAEANQDSQKQLHASLALLPVDDSQLSYLYERLLQAGPGEAVIIRDMLAKHKEQLAGRLWDVARHASEGHHAQCLRACCALASYDPGEASWREISRALVQQLIAAGPESLQWMEALRPVRHKLLEPLVAVFRDGKEEQVRRFIAASILADYAADQPILRELVLDADETQFGLFFSKLKQQGAPATARLEAILNEPAPSRTDPDERERALKRKSNAIVALFRLGGSADELWPHLAQRADPGMRSYLVRRLAILDVEPLELIKQAFPEKDVALERNLFAPASGAAAERILFDPKLSMRRALLLSLGAYKRDRFSAHSTLLGRLEEIYRDHPDPGLHGAAEWLLRTWNQQQRIRRCEAPLKTGNIEGKRGWFLNRQGQTMVVIPGPVELIMGSPVTEPEREGGREGPTEKQRLKKINRSFAVATREVTVEQFLRFKPDHRYDKKHAPQGDCPVTGVTWYQAAEFCNWLNKQEKIDKSQWCFLPNVEGKYAAGMKFAPDYLKRTGYRLPTEAEWEYACRAGAATSRYHGDGAELLGQYAWYTKNSQDVQLLPAGSLRPNDWGLFDMLGNVWEWTLRRVPPDSLTAEGAAGEDKEDGAEIEAVLPHRRITRGGSFISPHNNVRCSQRNWIPPTSVSKITGLRVARTIASGQSR